MSKAAILLNFFEAADVQKVKDITKELLDKFFSEFDLPVPDIKIKNNLSSRWLARHVCFNINRENSNIEVQKSILDDDRTLRRVIAHELIHHWQCFKEKDEKTFNPAYRRTMKLLGRDTGHGDSFKAWAEKINAVMGDNYVTAKSDQEYLQSPAKDFYIVVKPFKKDFNHPIRYSFAVFQRPSEKLKQMLNTHPFFEHTKIFIVNDREFLKYRAVLGSGRSSLTVPTDSDVQNRLKDLYSGDKAIKL